MVQKQKSSIWMDGHFVAWDDAKIHPISNTVQYGMGVFEGLRTYLGKNGTSIFRLHDHTKRLFESAHILNIKMPFTQDELNRAQIETARKSNLTKAYIRPTVYLGWESLGLHAKNLSTHVMIATWDMGEYLHADGPDAGLRLITSSFSRINTRSLMCKAKATGHYINSTLAFRDATALGFDDAIMLDAQGCIAEASTSNIFAVKNGIIYTPTDTSILKGITRDTVFHICKDQNLELVTKDITRDEAYTADEIFISGTAAEIKSVGEIDNRKIGSGTRGPVTKRIQEAFQQIVTGHDSKHSDWLTPV